MNLNDNYQLYRNIIENNISEEELFLLKLQDNEIADFALKMIKYKKDYPSLLMLPEEFLNCNVIYRAQGLLMSMYELEDDLKITNCNGLNNGIEFLLSSDDDQTIKHIIINVYSVYFSNNVDIERLNKKLLDKYKK